MRLIKVKEKRSKVAYILLLATNTEIAAMVKSPNKGHNPMVEMGIGSFQVTRRYIQTRYKANKGRKDKLMVYPKVIRKIREGANMKVLLKPTGKAKTRRARKNFFRSPTAIVTKAIRLPKKRNTNHFLESCTASRNPKPLIIPSRSNQPIGWAWRPASLFSECVAIIKVPVRIR
jgi:hypothetical protein